MTLKHTKSITLILPITIIILAYTLQVSATSTFEVTLSLSGSIAYSTGTDMIVGVNGPHWNLGDTDWYNRDLPLLQECGIKHVRLGIGIKNSYLDRCADADISVIATLSDTGLPDDLEIFRQYVYNRVYAYRGKVEGWIVLNEVNIFYEDITKERYLEILRTANSAIKEADPNALTLTSNFAYADRAREWMEELYRLDPNVNQYYDVVAVDAYCYRVEPGTPSPPNYPYTDMFGHGFWELENLKGFLESKGDNTPIWIIEFGWPTADDMSSVSEETQAEYIEQALNMANNWGWIERIYIYNWMDSVEERKMGILRNSYPYEKPSFNAVKDFIANK